MSDQKKHGEKGAKHENQGQHGKHAGSHKEGSHKDTKSDSDCKHCK